MADFKETNLLKRGLICSVERHLWSSGIALAIYHKVSDLTHGGESTYYTSVNKMATFLGCSERQARRAFAYLDRQGWLTVLAEPPKNVYQLRGQTNTQKERRIVSHDDWAKTHPNVCYERESMPWDNEWHDPLGAQLYRLSSGKLKWHPEELKALRRRGLPDNEIAESWKRAIATQKGVSDMRRAEGLYANMNWKRLKWDFVRQLSEFKPVAA